MNQTGMLRPCRENRHKLPCSNLDVTTSWYLLIWPHLLWGMYLYFVLVVSLQDVNIPVFVLYCHIILQPRCFLFHCKHDHLMNSTMLMSVTSWHKLDVIFLLLLWERLFWMHHCTLVWNTLQTTEGCLLWLRRREVGHRQGSWQEETTGSSE